MKKKLLIALGVVVAIVLLGVGYVVLQPSEFRIARSITIDAPPSQVFPYLNNLRKWDDWSPWAKLDPNAANTFEGPEAGEGARFRWSGNDDIGEGSMTITESDPNKRVQVRLEFVRPFQDTNTTEFSLQPQANKTVVTWSMFGRRGLVNKTVCMLVDVDSMLGTQFDQGLAKMKTVVEANSASSTRNR